MMNQKSWDEETTQKEKFLKYRIRLEFPRPSINQLGRFDGTHSLLHDLTLHRIYSTDRGDELSAAIQETEYLDPRNEVGQTPLHWLSAFFEPTTELELLLQRGASVNARDKWGQTPLHFAARYAKEPGTIQLLLKFDANPTLCDQIDRIPLEVLHAENEQLLRTEDRWRLEDAEWWTEGELKL